ncbi:MAG: 50S ribosomal protein L25 [Clostridia bacterium]|nr:50S ribosomal protein L25 [Clostridia bacterium]
MDIYTLSCGKRDLAIKAKQIRKNGFVPAVVYGHNIDSLGIQINQNTAKKFAQTHSVGSKVLLIIDGKEQLSLFKDFQRDPIKQNILHIDFHALTSGEAVKVSLPIVYINKDSIGKDIFLQEQMNEIEISTLPQYLIDYISVDLSKYSLGDSVHVRDLDIFSDENFDVLSSPESLVCSLTHKAKFVDEVEEEPSETSDSTVPEKTNEK